MSKHQDLVLSLLVTDVPKDPLKKFLLSAGVDKKIVMIKVDLMLKCSSMPVITVESSHENTITNMSFLGSDAIATTSIDKQVGFFKFQPEIKEEKEKEKEKTSFVKQEEDY